MACTLLYLALAQRTWWTIKKCVTRRIFCCSSSPMCKSRRCNFGWVLSGSHQQSAASCQNCFSANANIRRQ